MALLSTLGILYVLGRRAIGRMETVDWRDIAPRQGGRFVATRSGRVHCVEMGEGSAVLLFHGSGRSVADWLEGSMQALSKRRRVIAFDYYGCGCSERNPKFTYGYGLWIQQAIDLLDALGVGQATLVGHSVGGALALIVASAHPDRVDHVVTIGTGVAVEPAQFLPVIPGVGEFLMSRVTMFGPAMSRQNAEALEAAFKIRGTRAALLMYIRRQMTVDGLSTMARRVLQNVRAPILHISASEDRNISVQAARRLTWLTGSDLIVIPGATHMVHCEKPAEVTTEIERFLAL